MRMPRIGDNVIIDLDDHSSTDGDESLGKVTAHGKVVKVEDDKIVLDCWHATNSKAIRKLGINEIETFVIVRRAILAIHRVTETEEL